MYISIRPIPFWILNLIPTSKVNRRRPSTKKGKDAQTVSVRAIDNVAVRNRREFSERTVCRFPGCGFPDELRCTLKYTEQITMSGTPTTPAQVFRMNSLFDPNLTGTGHQPNYYDQLQAVYGQYCVTSAKLTAKFASNQSAIVSMGVMLYSENNIGTLTVENLCETKYAMDLTVGGTNANPTRSFALPTANVTKMMGQSALNTDPNTYSIVTSNPTDVLFGIIKFTSSDAVTGLNLECMVTLYFDCIFKELQQLTES